MVAQDGFFNGQQIVPAAWLAETRRGNPNLFGADYRATMPKGAYRNQFWIEDYEHAGAGMPRRLRAMDLCRSRA